MSGLSSISISESIFLKNYAKTSGGAISAANFNGFNISYTSFEDNYAFDKGSEFYGLYSKESMYLTSIKILK